MAKRERVRVANEKLEYEPGGNDPFIRAISTALYKERLGERGVRYLINEHGAKEAEKIFRSRAGGYDAITRAFCKVCNINPKKVKL